MLRNEIVESCMEFSYRWVVSENCVEIWVSILVKVVSLLGMSYYIFIHRLEGLNKLAEVLHFLVY